MSRSPSIAEKLGVHPRWLPSEEHAEKIAEKVAAGRCYIEHRGHGVSPLLVFEDGGAMELPTVRWMKAVREYRLVSVSETYAKDQTTHSDVCGTVDAIEAALGDTELADHTGLLEDLGRLIRRMKLRRDKYEELVENASAALNRPIRRKDVDPAYEWLEELKNAANGVSSNESASAIVEKLEAVRDVAQYLEYSLRDYKELALELEQLVNQVRGARDWSRR